MFTGRRFFQEILPCKWLTKQKTIKKTQSDSASDACKGMFAGFFYCRPFAICKLKEREKSRPFKCNCTSISFCLILSIVFELSAGFFKDAVGNLFFSGVVHALDVVDVDHGRIDIGMAQNLLNLLHAGALLQGDGGC